VSRQIRTEHRKPKKRAPRRAQQRLLSFDERRRLRRALAIPLSPPPRFNASHAAAPVERAFELLQLLQASGKTLRPRHPVEQHRVVARNISGRPRVRTGSRSIFASVE